MEWNNKYTYPKSSRSIENGYRKYLFGDEKLPSVTTILSATTVSYTHLRAHET